jgi:hypothetical protein
MAAVLAVTALLAASGTFEGFSRQTAVLLDGWVAGAPTSPVAPDGGSLLEMSFALIRAEAALETVPGECWVRGGGMSRCLKAAAACVDWYRGSLALFGAGAQGNWPAREEGLLYRLGLLQSREMEYLEESGG